MRESSKTKEGSPTEPTTPRPSRPRPASSRTAGAEWADEMPAEKLAPPPYALRHSTDGSSPATSAGVPIAPPHTAETLPRSASARRQATPLGTTRRGQDHLWIALVSSLVAAVGYTAANVCLRSVTDQPPEWVSCIKSIPTVALALPWTVGRLLAGNGIVSRGRDVGLLILAALVGQLLGNVSFQWSLGVVGLALAVPLTLGSLIVSGAILGPWLLADRLSMVKAMAGAVLVLAIVVLSMGADSARAAVASAPPPDGALWHTLAGVLAACGAGVAYSCLGVAIRYTGRHGMPMSSTLLLASLVGMVALGGWTYARQGPSVLAATSAPTWGFMVAAGVFNAIAFLAFTKALHTGSLFFVNAVNTTQCSMAAVLGIVLFGEPPTVWLGLGIGLTIAGLVLMSRRDVPRPVDESRRDGSLRPVE